MLTKSSAVPKAKSVAIAYLLLAVISGIAGTACSGYIRVELSHPQLQVSESSYYSLITAHGLLFVFLVLVPLGQAFLNWWMPGMLGTDDFVWPRANIGGALGTAMAGLIIASFWLIGGGWGPGWTLYPPLAYQKETASVDGIIAGIHILGLFSGLAGINTLVTSGIRHDWVVKCGLFVWTQIIAALLLVVSLPALALGVTGLLFDRTWNMSWFDPLGGGDPVLFQSLFWFFGHPEVYVVILPAFGVVSASLESTTTLFGENGMLASVVCLGLLGFLVYAHHMFTLELETEVKLMFSATTMGIAVPTGVKIFAWLMTLRSGYPLNQLSISLICFTTVFTGGGITGIILSAVAIDLVLHDTYFVVAHFHQVMAISAFLGFSMGIKPLELVASNKTLASLGVVWFTVGSIVLFMPLYMAGITGLPRRVPSYPLLIENFTSWTLVGYLGSVLGVLIFVASFSA